MPTREEDRYVAEVERHLVTPGPGTYFYKRVCVEMRVAQQSPEEFFEWWKQRPISPKRRTARSWVQEFLRYKSQEHHEAGRKLDAFLAEIALQQTTAPKK